MTVSAMPLADAKLAGVILAAGGSSRLGRPKQLLSWQGETLVRRAVQASLALCGAGITVVTGAFADDVVQALHGCPVSFVNNPDWQSGMAKSLQAAITSLPAEKLEGVLITLCDQPLISVENLACLLNVWQTAPGRPIASSYGNVTGVPAIFPRTLFPVLSELSGDAGARSVLANSSDVISVPMPNAAFDVDTQADLEQLLSGDFGGS
jgi:molybdenum cofactor cytidylyltransferase